MIFNEAPKMKWEGRLEVFVNDGFVNRVEGVPGEFYNPFDEDGLYRDFVSQNDKGIVDFIKSYGFLGVSSHKNRELLSDISKEIARMKSIVLLWDVIRSKDVKKEQLVHASSDFIAANNEKEGLPEEHGPLTMIAQYRLGNISADDLRGQPETIMLITSCKAMIAKEVNKELQHVTPVLNWRGEPFLGTWTASSLLSAMYAQLYMDLLQGAIIRKCRNETCPKFFKVYGADDRKIFCDHSCASTQSQREYRRRKKAEEEGSDHS